MGILDRIAGRIDDLAQKAQVPAEARAELELATALADRGDLAEAEARLEDLVRRFADFAPVHRQLGELRARRGDDEGAVLALGRAVDLDGDDGAALLALGEALVRRGRSEPAADAFRRAIAALRADEARLGRARASLGRLHAAAGHSGKAVRELRKAAALLPQDLALAADLGDALLLSGDSSGGDWLLRAAEAPGADPALALRAASAAADDAAAERVLRAALDRSPSPALRAGLARRLAATGRTVDALPLALAAVAEAPDEPGPHAALREIYARGGRLTDALAEARREADLGAPPPREALLPLALAVRDRPALAALGISLPAPPPLPAGDLFAALDYARRLSAGSPELVALALPAARAAEAFDRPLVVAVMGEFNAGKSSFVNALVGAEVAPVGVTPTTATINVLRHGPSGGRILYHDGASRDLGGDDEAAFLRGLDDQAAARVRSVELFRPLDFLRRVEIVDTPGLNSLRPQHEAAARGFLREADAIVWLFSVGQAAKETEREALVAAHAAGKRVLGVLNKSDRAEPAELAQALDHVRRSLGVLVEDVVALSARDALDGRLRPDARLVDRSGLPSVEAALEARFFGDARALKRSTALSFLRGFVADARAAAGSAAPTARDLGAERTALARREGDVRGALAAERVALRARLDEAARQAAYEVREFVRPRGWLFGEHSAEPADRDFLRELLEDAVGRAVEPTFTALGAAAATGPSLPLGPVADRFRAYLRGVLAGGAVEDFFRHDLPRLSLDAGAIRNAIASRLPDPEDELFGPLGARIAEAYREARERLAAAEADDALARLMHEERLVRPVDGLAAAVASLALGGRP